MLCMVVAIVGECGYGNGSLHRFSETDSVHRHHRQTVEKVYEDLPRADHLMPARRQFFPIFRHLQPLHPFLRPRIVVAGRILQRVKKRNVAVGETEQFIQVVDTELLELVNAFGPLQVDDPLGIVIPCELLRSILDGAGIGLVKLVLERDREMIDHIVGGEELDGLSERLGQACTLKKGIKKRQKNE